MEAVLTGKEKQYVSAVSQKLKKQILKEHLSFNKDNMHWQYDLLGDGSLLDPKRLEVKISFSYCETLEIFSYFINAYDLQEMVKGERTVKHIKTELVLTEKREKVFGRSIYENGEWKYEYETGDEYIHEVKLFKE